MGSNRQGGATNGAFVVPLRQWWVILWDRARIVARQTLFRGLNRRAEKCVRSTTESWGGTSLMTCGFGGFRNYSAILDWAFSQPNYHNEITGGDVRVLRFCNGGGGPPAAGLDQLRRVHLV